MIAVMADSDRDALGQALDLFVYAPIGFVLEARELVPRLARRGRGQVGLARVMGTLAVRQGRREVERVLNDILPDRAAPPAPPRRSGFPIDGYDELRVAEVLARLDGLDDHGLRMVRRHEEITRGRVTVLRRIDALLGS